VKTDEKGDIEQYKARLMGKGFSQKYGIDYKETFSPVIKFSSIWVLLTIAASEDWVLLQLDVTAAFLKGKLKEEIFMKIPDGYELADKDCNEGRDCLQLLNLLYGLKQVSQEWYNEFDRAMGELGFHPCQSDPCIYTKKDASGIVIIGIYVDDTMLTRTPEEEVWKAEGEVVEQV
jgi:hypothetical protein